jgi:hypothetical protein
VHGKWLCTFYRAGLGKTAVFVSTTGEQTLIGISHSQSNKLTGSCPQHSVAHRTPAQMPPAGFGPYMGFLQRGQEG